MGDKDKERLNLLIAMSEGWIVVPELRINGVPYWNRWFHKDWGDPLNPAPGAHAFARPPDYVSEYQRAKNIVCKYKHFFQE